MITMYWRVRPWARDGEARGGGLMDGRSRNRGGWTLMHKQRWRVNASQIASSTLALDGRHFSE